MEQIATELTFEAHANAAENSLINPPEVRLLEGPDQTHYIFYRNQLLAQYEKSDNYTRNMIIVQLFLCLSSSEVNEVKNEVKEE